MMKAKPEAWREVRQQVNQRHFALAADALSSRSTDAQAELLQNLPDEQAADVFRFMDTAYQEEILLARAVLF